MNKLLAFLILIIINLASINAKANVFDDIKACFTNPCNCGQSQITEVWGPAFNITGNSPSISALTGGKVDYQPGISFDQTTANLILKNFDQNSVCMPFNKNSGRSNCLKQFKYPGNWLGTYRTYCAEASPNSNFQNPVIRVRMQVCSFLVCYTVTADLNASGQCQTWPTQYVLPTIRFCARVAIPRISYDSNGNYQLNADPGYYFHFLDTNGYPWPDPGITTSSGNRVFLPKICLYEDPSVIEGTIGFGFLESYRQIGVDWADSDPGSMPYHTYGPGANNATPSFLDIVAGMKSNSIVENKYFFSETLPSQHFWDEFQQNPANYKPYNPAMHGQTFGGTTVNFQWQSDYSSWVKQFVREKNGGSLGCTFLPIGPFPPPFNDQPVDITGGVSIHQICPYTYSYSSPNNILSINDSFSYSQCVKSEQPNNFINNAFRISNDNYVPLCSNQSTNTQQDTSCVLLYPSTLTPQLIHYGYNDMLPLCSSPNPNDGNPCVLTSLKSNCTSGLNCSNKMRIVYTYSVVSGISTPMDGYIADALSQCSSNNGVFPCVGIYGINNGAYTDYAFNLSSLALPDDESPQYYVGNNVSLTSIAGDNISLTPLISFGGPETSISDSSYSLDPNSMCVYLNSGGTSTSAGCVPRAKPAILSAYSCNTAPSDAPNCGSISNFNPAVIAKLSYDGMVRDPNNTSLEIPTDHIYKVLTPRDLTSNDYTNFIGVNIDSLITDDNSYNTPPFIGPNSPNALTIYGNYAKDNPLFLANNQLNDSAEYLNGVEYSVGNYVRGGTKMYIADANYTRCHQPNPIAQPGSSTVINPDDSNCILTKLNYSDKVDCKAFNTQGYTALCPSDLSGCMQVSNLPISGSQGANIYFYQCSNNLNCYMISPASVAATMPLAVCQASQNPEDAFLPIDTHNDYFNYTAYTVNTNPPPTPPIPSQCAVGSPLPSYYPNPPYDNTKCTSRDKTIFERGVGAAIQPLPVCQQNTGGNATWPQTNIGQKSTGTCIVGYKAPTGGLQQRLCYLDVNNYIKIDPISAATTCSAVTCPGISSGDGPNGYATWQPAEYNNQSSGSCVSGYTAPPSGLAARTCAQNPDGSYSLSPLQAGSTCYVSRLNLSNSTNNTTVTITSNSQFASLSATPGKSYAKPYQYGCCTSDCGPFGCCAWGNGTCTGYNNFTKYTVTVGYPGMYTNYTNGSNFSFQPNPNPGSTNTTNVNISVNGQNVGISNVGFFGNVAVTKLNVNAKNNYNSCMGAFNGDTKCESIPGIAVDSYGGLIQFEYNSTQNPMGAGYQFDLYIPQ